MLARDDVSNSMLGARHSSGAHAHDSPLEWRAPGKDTVYRPFIDGFPRFFFGGFSIESTTCHSTDFQRF
jgi:hypothetical protein